MKINNFFALIALTLCTQYMIASDFGHARDPKPERKKAREIREALECENKKKKALLQQCKQDTSHPSRPRRPARGPL